MLRELPGVVNVVDIDFFNMQGGGYSETLHAQSTGAIENIIGTGGYRVAMNPQDNAIFGSSLAMFELRNPNMDVKIRVAS